MAQALYQKHPVLCRFCLICNGIHGVGNIFGPYLHGDKIIIFVGTPPTSHQLVKSHTGRATQHSAQYLSNFVRPPPSTSPSISSWTQPQPTEMWSETKKVRI